MRPPSDDDIARRTLAQIADLAIIDPERAARFHEAYQAARRAGDEEREQTIVLNVQRAYEESR